MGIYLGMALMVVGTYGIITGEHLQGALFLAPGALLFLVNLKNVSGPASAPPQPRDGAEQE